MLESFHFLRPYWLFALLPLALLVWLGYRNQTGAGHWARVCDAHLLPFVLIGRPGRRRRSRLILFALGGVLAITALAGPAWKREPSPLFHDSSALVIALDLSFSMDAGDLRPTRLTRARFKIEDILKRRKEGQTGFLVYAGDAFAVTPLTDDTDTISHQLAALSTALMPGQGRDIASALERAAAMLQQAGAQRGEVLMVTDNAGSANALEAAMRFKKGGYRLSVLGAGTEAGAPIPAPRGGFVKDRAGNIIVPKLDSRALRRLAKAGGGIYLPMAADSRDVDMLAARWEAERPSLQGEKSAMAGDRWREEGPWLLLPLLALAALAFRRGWLAVAIFLVLPWPRPGHAMEWRDWWATPDQQARRVFERGQYAEAAEKFSDSRWRAAAAYKAAKYEKAIEHLAGDDSAQGFYNRGNALTRLGRLREAVASYREALKIDPAHEDARHNRDLVEQALQQQARGQNGGDASDHSEQQPSADNGRDDSSGRIDAPEEKPDGAGSHSDGDGGGGGASGTESAEGAEQEEGGGASDESREQEVQGEAGEGEEDSDRRSATARRSEGDGDEESESQQAHEQWLRRIPDDPGGLLRRKFEYQYKQRKRQSVSGS